jgi:hypothetical protein
MVFSVYCNVPFSFYLYKLQVTTIELWGKGNGKKCGAIVNNLGEHNKEPLRTF